MPNFCLCGTQCKYGYPGEVAHRCAKCKLPGMIPVYYTVCDTPGCGILAPFGFRKEGRQGTRVCSKHKREGMINWDQKKCEKCDLGSRYNYPGEKGSVRCKEHKEDGMVHISNYYRQEKKKQGGAQKNSKPKVRYVDQISVGENGEITVFKKKVE